MEDVNNACDNFCGDDYAFILSERACESYQCILISRLVKTIILNDIII